LLTPPMKRSCFTLSPAWEWGFVVYGVIRVKYNSRFGSAKRLRDVLDCKYGYHW